MNIELLFYSIIKAHIIILLIVILSFIIEKLTGLKLLIDHYTWRKSVKNREVLSTGDSGFYIIFNLIVFIYDHYSSEQDIFIPNFFIWLILLSILTYLFYKIHFKYQRIDPTKTDDDYT